MPHNPWARTPTSLTVDEIELAAVAPTSSSTPEKFITTPSNFFHDSSEALEIRHLTHFECEKTLTSHFTPEELINAGQKVCDMPAADFEAILLASVNDTTTSSTQGIFNLVHSILDYKEEEPDQ